MRKKLFIPGPVEVRQEVLDAMGTPMIGHRTADATELQKSVSEKLQKVFHTENPILLSTTSGTGLMEGAMRSLVNKKVVVFSVGAFGDRWAELAESNNIAVDLVRSEWGQPTTPEMVEEYLSTGNYDAFTITHNETSTSIMNPVEEIAKVSAKYPEVLWFVDAVSSLAGAKIEVDKLGIDVCITYTQKALGVPPGLAICSISHKALEYGKNIKYRGSYLDLLSLYKYVEKKPDQYPSTPSLSNMYALDVQLDYILNVEGLENRFARHKEMAEVTRAWAKKHFDIFAAEGYQSVTLTNVKNTKGISVKELIKRVGERGYLLANGYGDMKEKTFRIAHMADTTMEELKNYLTVLEEEITKL
jgi:aspartate aminotransferase-like enzyme